MISAGEMDKRINIERLDAGQDAFGQPISTWSRRPAIWANIKHPSGVSAIKSSADVSIVRASIRIRFRTDIDAGMRVVHGTSIYDIKAVLPNRTKGHVDLVCERVQ